MISSYNRRDFIKNTMAFEGMKQHLAAAAKLDLSKATYRLGRSLEFDTKVETYPGDEEAKRFLSREYRSPYVLPDSI
jgi:hypothetical protein